MINDIALHKLMKSSLYDEESIRVMDKVILADETVVAAWYRGQPVYCQAIRPNGLLRQKEAVDFALLILKATAYAEGVPEDATNQPAIIKEAKHDCHPA